ncbi:MAG: sigma-54-dependent Fis family transcriptional regulator [Bacillota bacterium]
MSGSPKLAERKRLEKNWEQFINFGEFDQNSVDSTIAASWQRCKVAAVNPIGGACDRICNDDLLRQLLESNKILLEAATPVIESIYYTVQGSGFMVVLVNNEGIILKTMGDYKTLSNAELLNFHRGADWTEESVGTNAIGTCLTTGIPIQVTGPEHFCTGHHAWTCSAAPIRSTEGQVLGCLDMSGPHDKMHPHTLGMIVAAAKAIENQLRKEMFKYEFASTFNHLMTAVNTISDGILHVDAGGTITGANTPAGTMLGLPLHKLKGQRLDYALGNTRSARQLLAAVSGGSDREIVLATPYGTYSARVVTNRDKKFGGSLVILRESRAGGIMVKSSVSKSEAGDGSGDSRAQAARGGKSGSAKGVGADVSRARFTFAHIIGDSPQIRAAVELARRASAYFSTVLLLGESGSGKEIFAQAIHNASDRGSGPFIPVNCASMPAGLIQSELFGYNDGAFTGARRGGHPGKFELADGGTLFLDEIGDMPVDMQANLLRVLQEKAVTRVGGKGMIPVDVRVIAATNKDLHREVQNGSFREDLFYRINVLSIEIPPLRERVGDIDLLIAHYLAELPARLGKKIIRIDNYALKVLSGYHWPGNVRELANVLEQAIIVCDEGVIRARHLPRFLSAAHHKPALNLRQASTLEQLEMDAIRETLSRFRGNISRTARVLGIGRNTLYGKIKKYGIRL